MLNFFRVPLKDHIYLFIIYIWSYPGIHADFYMHPQAKHPMYTELNGQRRLFHSWFGAVVSELSCIIIYVRENGAGGSLLLVDPWTFLMLASKLLALMLHTFPGFSMSLGFGDILKYGISIYICGMQLLKHKNTETSNMLEDAKWYTPSEVLGNLNYFI